MNNENTLKKNTMVNMYVSCEIVFCFFGPISCEIVNMYDRT